jgi:hypothetical protein
MSWVAARSAVAGTVGIARAHASVPDRLGSACGAEHRRELRVGAEQTLELRPHRWVIVYNEDPGSAGSAALEPARADARAGARMDVPACWHVRTVTSRGRHRYGC